LRAGQTVVIHLSRDAQRALCEFTANVSARNPVFDGLNPIGWRTPQDCNGAAPVSDSFQYRIPLLNSTDAYAVYMLCRRNATLCRGWMTAFVVPNSWQRHIPRNANVSCVPPQSQPIVIQPIVPVPPIPNPPPTPSIPPIPVPPIPGWPPIPGLPALPNITIPGLPPFVPVLPLPNVTIPDWPNGWPFPIPALPNVTVPSVPPVPGTGSGQWQDYTNAGEVVVLNVSAIAGGADGSGGGFRINNGSLNPNVLVRAGQTVIVNLTPDAYRLLCANASSNANGDGNGNGNGNGGAARHPKDNAIGWLTPGNCSGPNVPVPTSPDGYIQHIIHLRNASEPYAVYSICQNDASCNGYWTTYIQPNIRPDGTPIIPPLPPIPDWPNGGGNGGGGNGGHATSTGSGGGAPLITASTGGVQATSDATTRAVAPSAVLALLVTTAVALVARA
jgi:hypothetical protein